MDGLRVPETQFDASVDDDDSVDVEADDRGIAINARKKRKSPGVDKVEREQKLLIKLISHIYLPREGTLTSTPQLERVHEGVQLSSFVFVANEGSRCT